MKKKLYFCRGMNAQIIKKQPRLTIRLTSGGLSFSVVDPTKEEQISYEPYVMKSGISQAANLRYALSTAVLTNEDYQRAQVIVDSPMLLIPLDEYNNDEKDELYRHSYPQDDQTIPTIVESMVLHQFNTVILFAINRDVKTVIEDHFKDVRYSHVCVPVWQHIHHRSFTGPRQKLYAYFFDGQVNVFSFQQNHLRFVNTFANANANNASFFLLYVWKQLGMDQQRDELHLLGTIPEKEEFVEELKKYLKNVYTLNPVAEYNRAPITQIAGIPYDLVTLYIRS